MLHFESSDFSAGLTLGTGSPSFKLVVSCTSVGSREMPLQPGVYRQLGAQHQFKIQIGAAANVSVFLTHSGRSMSSTPSRDLSGLWIVSLPGKDSTEVRPTSLGDIWYVRRRRGVLRRCMTVNNKQMAFLVHLAVVEEDSSQSGDHRHLRPTCR